jgi:demethylmenaquinone methyltransferase/2-methoxy-6-polyprenyl-1,4-benzoquinol methylase
MLTQAQDRIEAKGWRNVSLVQSDAAAFTFPTDVDAILSTYAMTQVPESAEVIAHGAAALTAGGRWAVLDLKAPDNTPQRLAQLGTQIVRHFASIDEWIMRRPWETIRAAMEEELTDVSWTELCFGTAFLAAGTRGPSPEARSDARLGGQVDPAGTETLRSWVSPSRPDRGSPGRSEGDRRL